MNRTFFDKQYKYQLIAEDIKRDIFSNHLKANTPLPSIRVYAEKYDVAPNTVANALHLLKSEDIIYAYRTKGYCISGKIEEIKIALAKKLINKLLSEIEHIGLTQQELMKLINSKYKE